MRPSTDDQAVALAWAELLGAMAATCDLAAAVEHRSGPKRELIQRADRYRDLQLANLHDLSATKRNYNTTNPL